MQKDLSQPAAGQDGGLGKNSSDLAAVVIVDVCADAGERLIDRQPVERVMRGRQQVNGRVLGQDLDVGLHEQCFDETLLDGASGGVVDVENATRRVGRLAGALKLVLRREGEWHLVLVHQQLAHELWSLMRQDRDCLAVIQPVAGTCQVLGQLFGRILLTGVDDAPWA